MPFLHILAVGVVAAPLYFVLVTVYRLTLHPLAKYPGPLSWKITNWPDAMAAVAGNRYVVYQQLHRKYGHIVRVGPNRLSFDTSKAFHDINTSRSSNVTKSGFVGYTMKLIDDYNIQQIPDKREHAHRRRFIAHAFTDAALKSAESFMLGAIENWTKAMNQRADKSTDGWSETKDLGHWTNLLTLDVFGELCFGESFHATDNRDHPFVHMVGSLAKAQQSMAYAPIHPLIVPILRSERLVKILMSDKYMARIQFRRSLRELIMRRQKLETDTEQEKGIVRKDFFHYVTQARDEDGNRLPLAKYVSEAMLLTIAGTDTTSTALSAALFYLNRDRSKFDKLRAEIDGAFDSVDDIHTGPALIGCAYLRACIEEALRLCPPVPGSLTRKSLAGGTEVDGIHVPAGIDLEVPISSLARNEEYFFPDVSAFTPERWILGSKLHSSLSSSSSVVEVTEESLSRQRAAFVPFSSGSRNCLGMRMAYMEMTLVLARLVFLFDTRFDPTRPTPQPHDDFVTEDYFVAAKTGPFLQFKLRPGKTV